MTMKRVDTNQEVGVPPGLDLISLPNDLTSAVKFNVPADEDVAKVATMRAGSEPWKSRGESSEESLQAINSLRPFIQVAKLQGHVIGYVTIERDGPVPGAAYM